MFSTIIQFFTKTFNNRECALITLALAALLFSAFSKGARSAIKGLLVIFFSKQILRIYALMVTYIAAWIYLFYRLELWELPLLKDTIKWFLFAATVTFFKVQKFQKDNGEYKKTFKEIIAGSTFLEFFTDKFSFSYLTELVLIPVATLLALMKVFTEKDQKYSAVNKFFRRLLMLIGFYFLGHIIYDAIAQWHTWTTLDSLKEFLLAPVLSILLLPFIFALSVHMTYQTQFIVLERKIKPPRLLKVAKRKAFWAFGVNYKSLMRWQNRLPFDELTTKVAIVNSITALKNTQQIEKHPPHVPYEKGWSPYLAQKFMEPKFIMGYYDPRCANNWMSDSNLVYTGDTLQSNYFRYEVLGRQDAATTLELHLTIMTPDEAIDIESLQLAYYWKLCKEALGCQELPSKLEQAVLNGKNCKLKINATNVELEKERWKNATNAWSVTLSLQRGEVLDF